MGYTDKTQQSKRMEATSVDDSFMCAYGLEDFFQLCYLQSEARRVSISAPAG